MSIRTVPVRVASSGSSKRSLWNAFAGMHPRLPGDGIFHQTKAWIDRNITGSSLFGNNVYPRVTFMGLADGVAFRILYLS